MSGLSLLEGVRAAVSGSGRGECRDVSAPNPGSRRGGAVPGFGSRPNAPGMATSSPELLLLTPPPPPRDTQPAALCMPNAPSIALCDIYLPHHPSLG